MIMWREAILGAGGAAILAVVGAVADPGADVPPHPAMGACMPARGLAAALAERYDERPFARGLDRTGLLLELFVSEKGTWTILMSGPDGCVRGVRAGTGFDAGRPV